MTILYCEVEVGAARTDNGASGGLRASLRGAVAFSNIRSEFFAHPDAETVRTRGVLTVSSPQPAQPSPEQPSPEQPSQRSRRKLKRLRLVLLRATLQAAALALALAGVASRFLEIAEQTPLRPLSRAWVRSGPGNQAAQRVGPLRRDHTSRSHASRSHASRSHASRSHASRGLTNPSCRQVTLSLRGARR